MKATFDIAGDNNSTPNDQHFQAVICFNGLPDRVVLEMHRISFRGFSGSGDNPITEETKRSEMVVRSVLKSSEARAIASALLSAATEAKQ